MKKFKEILDRLNPEQLATVKYLDGPLLVLAGPGTGKTQLLSAKVAYILENVDISPENILCVTFTDSGCENMRERLASMIGAIPASKVNIHTYHTLGTDILYAYKNYSETFSRTLDSAIDDVKKYKIIKSIQKSLPGTDILKGDRISDITETISNAKSNRLTADEIERIAKINIDESEVLSKAISPLLEKVTKKKLHPSLEDAYQPILDLLDASTIDTPIFPRVEHFISLLRSDLSSAIDEAVEKNSITPLSQGWQKTYFEPTSSGTYRLKDNIANKKLLSLSNVIRSYEAYLRENGLYDFDDMIEEAIKSLKEDDGFRLSLEEKYQYILLDEFQDTNPSQFEIIRLLTDYEKPSLMAVGDDDQAIYEFQGAKASNLSDFKKIYDAKVINLITNYRSTQDILDFSKHIIDQVEDSFTKSQPDIEKTLTAFFKEKEGTISRHEFLASDGEYFWIANEISRLIEVEKVHPRDIAILTPKHKYALPLLPYLHAKHIPISYAQSENILEDPRIHELLTLSRFVFSLSEGKGQLHLLPEILSFPFWGLDHFAVLDAIHSARNDKKSSLDALKNSDDSSLIILANFLANLSVKSFDTPIETFFSYLLGTSSLDGYTSPFLTYYGKNLTSFQTFDLYEKLSVLKSTISKHSENLSSAPKLKDLISLLDDYEDASASLTNTSPYQDSDDSVSVLSAHKSKGLEFEYVFLICADHTAWGKGKGNNNLLSLPKNLAHIRHTGVTDGERLRLLFVAITRARAHLYITNSLRDFSGKSPARLEYLNESEDGDNLISPYIPKDSEKFVTRHYSDLENEKKETDLSISWLDTYLHPDPDTLSLYRSRVEKYSLSASALTSFIDVVYAGPKKFFERQVLRVPNEPTTASIAFGNSIHHTFERITEENLSDTEAINFFKQDITKEDIDPDTLKDLLEKGPENLKITLKSFGALLRAQNSRAEVDFRPEHLCFEGIPLTGKIDHLAINDEEKTLEIYDFKTSTYKDAKWGSSSDALFKYAMQLNFYKLLLNLSPSYRNYTIKRAHILFVTPDKYGEVHDKPYDFNETDETLLKSLIPRVYEHMQSLDFLNNPDLMIDPDPKKNLKDIKSFIELL